MGSILVVDDERSMREFLGICLKRFGHDVCVAEDGDSALATLEQQTFDIVITDLNMPGNTDGLGVVQAVHDRGLPTDVIVVTAFASTETAIVALRHGAYDYLTKPFKVDDINAVINRALEKRTLIAANKALRARVSGRYELASIIGRSPQMQWVFEIIRKVHSTRTSLLVTGESGTGKELIARAVHYEGCRANSDFVAVNCGAIPEQLLESELFGHVRGAFTGAVQDKKGLFERADGGTLFLDEIGELGLSLQVKLLRALQERRVKPVGATEEVPVNTRVVAATNRDLEAEVERGAFRGDLYYRLNVIEIHIAPLRERPEDIPPLLDHFLARCAAEQGKPTHSLTREARDRLLGHSFPGNVRELENIIEFAITMSSTDAIGTRDLPKLRAMPNTASRAAGEIDFPDDGVQLDTVVADFERALVREALLRSSGVRKRAARLLGVSMRSLRYRLEKLGIHVKSDLD